ncbi:hypothetical protein CAMRE0001_0489 [Campylobacter rectus RM3267]|uniref:Uncharacterized protein n=1 Tax=Campylobacter rectus RM3267 TaxID=553218 RepID=B9D2W7_CAMRE|nr:hypothetical protein CAMRE0001_0489 [Campylobacter rectus RM3267]
MPLNFKAEKSGKLNSFGDGVKFFKNLRLAYSSSLKKY